MLFRHLTSMRRDTDILRIRIGKADWFFVSPFVSARPHGLSAMELRSSFIESSLTAVGILGLIDQPRLPALGCDWQQECSGIPT
jgi:hypothetical protein